MPEVIVVVAATAAAAAACVLGVRFNTIFHGGDGWPDHYRNHDSHQSSGEAGASAHKQST